MVLIYVLADGTPTPILLRTFILLTFPEPFSLAKVMLTCYRTCLIRLTEIISDYNNARVLDFQDVPNYVSNAVSIQETARMPWHDVKFSNVAHIVFSYMTTGAYDTRWARGFGYCSTLH